VDMKLIGLTEPEHQALLAARSDDEWNAACLAIKKVRGGQAYPPDWYEKVLADGGAFHQFQARMGRTGSGISVNAIGKPLNS